MTRDTGWFRSSFSGTANDNCVEVRLSDLTVGVRDSKSPSTGTLRFSPSHWRYFSQSLSEAS
jgi:Domain of unknown function (DUF397)